MSTVSTPKSIQSQVLSILNKNVIKGKKKSKIVMSRGLSACQARCFSCSCCSNCCGR